MKIEGVVLAHSEIELIRSVQLCALSIKKSQDRTLEVFPRGATCGIIHLGWVLVLLHTDTLMER